MKRLICILFSVVLIVFTFAACSDSGKDPSDKPTEASKNLTTEKDVVGLALSGTYALVLHADGTLTAPCAPKAIQALCRPES